MRPASQGKSNWNGHILNAIWVKSFHSTTLLFMCSYLLDPLAQCQFQYSLQNLHGGHSDVVRVQSLGVEVEDCRQQSGFHGRLWVILWTNLHGLHHSYCIFISFLMEKKIYINTSVYQYVGLLWYIFNNLKYLLKQLGNSQCLQRLNAT